MQNFRNLLVWQKAHELALLTYRLTVDFPKDEAFGLRNSLRKTAVDIPAYIAEGSGKRSDAEFYKALSVAIALTNRLEYYALIAKDLTLLNDRAYGEHQDVTIEVKKLINGFSKRLE